MIRGARYTHTNLIARDWRALAAFYEKALGCVPATPARVREGANIEAGTAIPGARFEGQHLRLPGYGEDGPTIEIFQYEKAIHGERPELNRPGLAHLAFAVDSVAEAAAEFIRLGGSPVGEMQVSKLSRSERVTWRYLRDPEGNIVELQQYWSEPGGTRS